MKKLIIFLLSIISGLTLLFAACTSSNSTEKNACEHDWGIWYIIEEANCVEEGKQIRICSKCQLSQSQNFAKTGHTPITDEAIEATCTTTGLTEGSHCSKCNTIIIEQQTLPAKGHNYIDHYCSICNDIQPPQSLEDLVFFYENDLINFAKTFSYGVSDDIFEFKYTVCILDQEQTVQYIQPYQITPEIQSSQIERGLFVKCEVVEISTQKLLDTTYYNFGLQLTEEYEKLNVSTTIELPSGTYTDSWELLPLAENTKVFFEFSIIYNE